jgi:hypothetical protein
MSSAQTSAMVKIINYLPIVEKILLTALAIGTILTLMKIDSTVTSVSLLGLGATFFLYTYKLIDIPRQENEQFGFSTLLGLVIVPKILWISSAVSALGIAFYVSDLGNDGYKAMLRIGAVTIGIGTLLLVAFLASGVKHIQMATPVLLRTVPLFLVDMYLLLK